MSQNSALSRFILAFIAGFLAVVIFHQGMLALLHGVNLTPRSPFPTAPTQPFGIPQIWSSAFWGGVWGLVFVTIAPRFRQDKSYWISALLFGAIAPTLVAWFLVAPLKNQPIAGGFQPAAMLTGLLVNGAWGIGTALLLSLFSKRGISGGGTKRSL
ncbi:hypothetical protein [Allocoleopsis sp.]|uniref:hypothetical protein n=1 Tax=Allocoleopsis sp. TaxID=3088169 RepID=UPI002FCEF813